jgi:hypothetical protein
VDIALRCHRLAGSPWRSRGSESLAPRQSEPGSGLAGRSGGCRVTKPRRNGCMRHASQGLLRFGSGTQRCRIKRVTPRVARSECRPGRRSSVEAGTPPLLPRFCGRAGAFEDGFLSSVDQPAPHRCDQVPPSVRAGEALAIDPERHQHEIITDVQHHDVELDRSAPIHSFMGAADNSRSVPKPGL